MNRLPAIASDIDGVVVRGREVIGNSDKIIAEVLTPMADGKTLPFILLTNGGGFTEEKKAEEINRVLGIEESNFRLEKKHIVQCHTPLSDPALVHKYQDKFVLVSGYDEVLSAALAYGYKHAVHVDELAAVYPKAVPLDIPILAEERMQAFIRDLETRFGLPVERLRDELRFAAIFIMHGVIYSDMTIQIFSDLLASTDGHICGPRRRPSDPQVVELFMTNPDIVWPYTWPIPRFGPKTFLLALQAVFKAYYGMDVEYHQYGKPEKPTFDFAEALLRRQAAEQDVEVSQFYMIGDNPDSDIDGANRKGWVSVLVRTGIFTGETPNSEKHPATHVVQDMEAAFRLIIALENLN